MLAACALAVSAKPAEPLADDEAVEQRLIGIADELRCLVCQNESLAGSRAELAQDLRREIRTLIKAGKSDAEVMDFLVTRYGDFVRYRPPLKPSTWLLWGGPGLLLVIGAGAMVAILRRRENTGPAPLNDVDRARAARLLRGDA
ncbi:cytochrome c-type biogenesis protein CcmH [Aquincola sp. S2]|uniref:Cytochrome c-type biogenesis protein n=1 Tax=Pseudaquabacterium terrae TaxID=2732868 RepID=A0ABX2EQV3_9BURK|nr:cytochrome c-type biogenesis protein [Aquabacterium terrae]NRF71060.1 cytochrome c-type biogenesis protein CcmH [Aquabacterium terrae]